MKVWVLSHDSGKGGRLEFEITRVRSQKSYSGVATQTNSFIINSSPQKKNFPCGHSGKFISIPGFNFQSIYHCSFQESSTSNLREKENALKRKTFLWARWFKLKECFFFWHSTLANPSGTAYLQKIRPKIQNKLRLLQFFYQTFQNIFLFWTWILNRILYRSA